MTASRNPNRNHQLHIKQRGGHRHCRILISAPRCRSRMSLSSLVSAVLLVSHGCACGSRELDDLATTEPCLFAPLGELGAGEVKRLAKFDQHVQRHHETEGVLPALVIDDVLD